MNTQNKDWYENSYSDWTMSRKNLHTLFELYGGVEGGCLYVWGMTQI